MADEPDDLRGDVAAALASLETPEAVAEAPAVEVPETESEKAERVRDEQGRFAKAEEPKEKRETLSLKKPPAPESPPGAAASLEPAAAQPAAPEKRVGPPPGFDGLGNVQWEKLPPHVQRNLIAREDARNQVIADLAPVKELIDVNREFLVNQAGSLPAAFQQLMQFARMSVDNAPQLIQHIAQARGVNLAALVNGQPGGDRPAAAPAGQQPQDLPSLIAQLVDQRVRPILAEREQQQTQQLQSTINQFGADPKHPFFNDVRVQMGQLISSGTAKSLDEAYEQATWANPAIRAHLLEEQRESAEKAKAAEVAKARAATRTSVTGSPLPGVGLNGKGDPKASALDDVRAAYNELSGA